MLKHASVFAIYQQQSLGLKKKKLKLHLNLFKKRYISYGENTNEDFIKSFSDLPDSLYYMVYVAYMIVVTFSIPVVFFSGRNYLMTLITRYGLK